MTVHGTVVAVCHRLLNFSTLSVPATDCIDVSVQGIPVTKTWGVLPLLVVETACQTWSVRAKVLNKEMQKEYSGRPSSLCCGQGNSKSSLWIRKTN